MTGLLLLSNDGFYATRNGGMSWGPSSDKAWLRTMITNEIVLVGHQTFESVRDFDGLMCLPKKWLVDTTSKVYNIKNASRFCKSCHEAYPADSEPTIHFGGPLSMLKYKPDKFIIHKAPVDLGAGLRLPEGFFDGFEILYTNQDLDYEEIIYVKKK